MKMETKITDAEFEDIKKRIESSLNVVKTRYLFHIDNTRMKPGIITVSVGSETGNVVTFVEHIYPR